MNKNKLPYPLLISISHKGEIIFEQTFTECPIIIGRSSKCDIPLQAFDFLSRQHCAVNVIDDEVVEVSDLDSSNGIFFEGKKVKKAILKGTSQIEIGEILITLEFENSMNDQPTVVESNYDPEEEITNVKELKNLGKSNPACPVVDAAKTHHRDLEEEFGKKLGDQKGEKKKERIPFGPTPAKTEKALPQMVHFNGEHKPLDVKLKKDLAHKEKLEPSISVVSDGNPIHHKQQKAPAKHAAPKSHDKKPVIPHNNGPFKKPITPHHQASQLRPQQRVLESYVTWKDQIYDLHQFYAGDNVVIGPGSSANVDIPVMNKNLKLAKFDGMNTQVFIPQNLKFELESENDSYNFDEAAFSPSVTRKKNYYTLKLGASELVSVQITPDVTIHLRYAPAPRQLSDKIRLIKDEEMKTPGFIIGALELMIFMLIFFTKTKDPESPQKIMQERVARLIIEQKPPPPPPEEKKPEPKKEEKKVAEKKPDPPKKVVEKQPKPKKVVRLQKSKLLTKVNKYPVEVEKPMKVADKPVVANIQAVGALAALGAVSSKMPPSDVPVAININKNAGGQTALNTGGVIGALKTNTGKLAAGGFASVKTKGMGYGTGTGYGVQGIKGTAGSRAVAGTVVGAPSLVRLGKEDGLSRAQVMDVVKRYMTQIQQCYERSLIDAPGIAGRVEYEWEISPKGSVQWAKVKKSDISGGDNLNKCVTAIFKEMNFPVAKNGQNTIPNIGFPFGRL